MFCRLNDLKKKYVINVRNGSRLGVVSDAQIDTAGAMISALILKGRLRFWGLLGQEEDIVVKWSDIEVIGEDTILVNQPVPKEEELPRRGIFHLFSGDEEED